MAVVPIISQSWDTSSYVNPTRMNNIETNIATVSKATGVEYSSGVSVKDKIDTKPTIAYSQTDNLAKSFTFLDWSTYLLTIQTGSSNPGVAILSKLSNNSSAKLIWLSEGYWSSTVTVSGNTISCSETGYYYQMNLLALNY